MGVLQMYVTVPLKVYPPTRAIVSEVLMHLDLEKTNNLNAEEFAQVMALLSAQMLGRIVITVVFLLSCPVAGGVVWTMIAGWHTGEELVMPAWLRCGVSILVQLHLGPPLLTVTRENAASKKRIHASRPGCFIHTNLCFQSSRAYVRVHVLMRACACVTISSDVASEVRGG